MNLVAQRDKVRVMILRMVAGAIVGAAASGLFITFIGEPHMDLDDPAVVITIVAGLSYVLIGLLVGFGLVAPNAGAKLLNVEDAEEIREDTPKLRIAVLMCVLIGAFLLVLGLSGTGSAAMLDRTTALGLGTACAAGIVVTGWMSAGRYDEMTRQVGLEASSLTLYTIFVLAGGWAALAHLGYVSWISPLALLSGLTLLQLFMIFLVSARRGLLVR